MRPLDTIKMFLRIIVACLPLISLQVVALDDSEIESIKSTLREIRDTDQETRLIISEKSKTLKPDDPELKALWAKQNEIDAENQKTISEILENYGWPNKDEFGSFGPAEVIFLVIQHADLNHQKQYFEMVEQAVRAGDLKADSFALLQDRILVREGKEQIYGSQLQRDQVTGAISFYPIDDEENVDKRRLEIGLEPIAEYAKHFGINYRGPVTKQPE